MNMYERRIWYVKLTHPQNDLKFPLGLINYSLSFFFSSSSTRFLSSSIDLFVEEFMGLLNESFKEDIQRELPPFAVPRAMAYMTKFTPMIMRIIINSPIAARCDSIVNLSNGLTLRRLDVLLIHSHNKTFARLIFVCPYSPKRMGK